MRNLVAVLFAPLLLAASGGLCGDNGTGDGRKPSDPGPGGNGSTGGDDGGPSGPSGDSDTDAGDSDAGSTSDDAGTGSCGGSSGESEEARVARAMSDVNGLLLGIEREQTDTGSQSPACLCTLSNLTDAESPTGCGHLASCADAVPGDPCWGGPYVDDIPTDPWGDAYWATLSNGVVTVGSEGPDCVMGTADDITASG